MDHNEPKKPHTLVDEIERQAEGIIDAAWEMANREMNLDRMEPSTRSVIRMAFIVGIVTTNAAMLPIPPARHGALRHALVRMGHKKAQQWKEERSGRRNQTIDGGQSQGGAGSAGTDGRQPSDLHGPSALVHSHQQVPDPEAQAEAPSNEAGRASGSEVGPAGARTKPEVL